MARASKKRSTAVEKALHKFGAESIEKLAGIADSDETPQKLRADIWRWFAEMEFGKPTSKQQTDNSVQDTHEIAFEGELEEWSR